MKKQDRILICLFSISSILLPIKSQASSVNYKKIIGTATDANRKIVYIEEHTIKKNKGRVVGSTTIYKNAQKNIIAMLRSDYRKSLTLPVYRFDDQRHGISEGISQDAKGYFSYYKDRKTPQKIYRIAKGSKNIFAGQGWHYFLLKNLTRPSLIPKNIDMVFPSRATTYSLSIRKTFENPSTVKYQMSFSNIIIQLVAPTMTSTYDKNAKKMIRYEGPSNILTSNEELQNVTITYEYK